MDLYDLYDHPWQIPKQTHPIYEPPTNPLMVVKENVSHEINAMVSRSVQSAPSTKKKQEVPPRSPAILHSIL